MDDIPDSTDTSLSKFWEMGKDREAWCASWDHKELDTTEQLNNKNGKQSVLSLMIFSLTENFRAQFSITSVYHCITVLFLLKQWVSNVRQ